MTVKIGCKLNCHYLQPRPQSSTSTRVRALVPPQRWVLMRTPQNTAGSHVHQIFEAVGACMLVRIRLHFGVFCTFFLLSRCLSFSLFFHLLLNIDNPSPQCFYPFHLPLPIEDGSLSKLLDVLRSLSSDMAVSPHRLSVIVFYSSFIVSLACSTPLILTQAHQISGARLATCLQLTAGRYKYTE